MLKKVTDEFADPEDGDELVDDCVTSVTTGRTMAEIAPASDVWRSNRGGPEGRPRAKKVERGAAAVSPAPARDAGRRGPADGRTGSTSIKYDGYRLLLAVGEAARPPGPATARTGATSSGRWSRRAAKLPAGCLIDGEAVALDDEGEPSFQLLQSTLKERRGANLVFYAFDLLVDRRRGHPPAAQHRAQGSPRGAARRRAAADPLRRPRHRPRRGAVPRGICKQGGEGIISKRADAPYRGAAAAAGSRSSASSARNS